MSTSVTALMKKVGNLNEILHQYTKIIKMPTLWTYFI
jgi:hypothetical protein